MTGTTLPPTERAARVIASPEALADAMQADYPPSPEQWEAIRAPLAPAVVIAGAGSGKTTLMAARVVYLVLTGQVRPDQVLGLTFTTKAAAELRTRVRAALTLAGALPEPGRRPDAWDDEAGDAVEPTVATYHAYAASLLHDHGLRIGHEPDTRVVTDAARYQLGARAIARHDGEVHHLTDHPETAIQNLLALDSAMSEHLVTPDRVRALDAEAREGFCRALEAEIAGRNRKTYREPMEKAVHAIDRRAELLDLVGAYRRLKADLGLMDFSDQIELAARLAVDQPDVGREQRERYRVVLLDEYQDTSVAQALLLSRLFSGPTPADGLGHPVMAVGDPQQAIYGWRGASVSNILGFGETFPSPGAATPTLPLTVNRRSDRRILEVANRLAGPLLEATPSVRPLRAAPNAAEGVVEAAVFETDAEELAWLAQAVVEARTQDAHVASWADIAVLTRDNAHAEGVYDALTGAGVPVEIVGLSGLLRLPEVAEVVATLHLLHDVTDNAAVLTLLSGPRWAIGPRDLRLLARRAADLAGRRDATPESLSAQLDAIADGVDPAEIPSLDDALADPGEAESWAYSPEARERFGLLAAELRQLRQHVGEPLLDVVRRVVDVSGVDVELAASVSPAAGSRRENLDLFVKAVADFQAVDGDTSLPALLAYLTAEDEAGNGLDAATPSESDSVKLLTVHRSKGLEWATVFCVGVCETRFPSTRGRGLWISTPSVLPAPLRGDARDLPHLEGWDAAAVGAYRDAVRAHDRTEELRLGYVAFTRAAHRLVVTSYLWSTGKRPLGPSPFQREVAEQLADWGEPVTRWLERPESGTPNPRESEDPAVAWPGPGAEAARRLEAARRVREADPDAPDEGLDMIAAARVAEWDDELARLLREALADRGEELLVPLPATLSATALARLREDPDTFARDLARPMPRRPSAAARFGTRFHAWVEARFGQQDLFDYADLPGRADEGIEDADDLAALVAAFESGPFGTRTPYAVEAPFALVIAGRVVRGRIDAVYREPDGSFLVLDWKTNRAHTADPLQLAVYRVAWAELHDIPLAQVRAAFCYVRTGEVVEPDALPDRAGLAELLQTAAPGRDG